MTAFRIVRQALASGPRRFAVQAALLNLPFILVHPDWPLLLWNPARSLLINAVIFVIPGIGFVGVARKAGLIRHARIIWVLVGSLAAFLLSLVLHQVIDAHVSGGSLWTGTWITTNVLIVTCLIMKVDALWPSFHRSQVFLPVGAFCVGYAVLFVSASRIVPALGDQDDELQGTAHGLITNLKPSLRTGRGTEYLFAHPPLMHLYVAEALSFYGILPQLADYDSQGPTRLSPAEAARRFREKPFLLETRTPSIFLGALTVALVAWIASRLTASPILGGLLAAAYLTTPEVFVRSTYAGYFVLPVLLSLLLLIAIERLEREPDREGQMACVMTGALLALADHKMIVLALSVLLWNVVRGGGKRRGPRLHPAVTGFAAGTALFWLYGLTVSARDFWMDHVRHHLVDRALRINTRNLDLSVYPDLPEMWIEFLRDAGPLLIPFGAVAIAMLSFWPGGNRSDAFRAGWRGVSGILLLWIVITAAVFSIVDWRQTKHLAPIALPVVLAVAALAHDARWRRIVVVVVVVTLFFNAFSLRELTTDFSGIVKSPEW